MLFCTPRPKAKTLVFKFGHLKYSFVRYVYQTTVWGISVFVKVPCCILCDLHLLTVFRVWSSAKATGRVSCNDISVTDFLPSALWIY